MFLEILLFESLLILVRIVDIVLEEFFREISFLFINFTCRWGYEKGSGRKEKYGYLLGFCSVRLRIRFKVWCFGDLKEGVVWLEYVRSGGLRIGVGEVLGYD